MEFDEFLLLQLRDGKIGPTLRVYGWNPPAISIGLNQRAEDFDLKKLQEAGIDLVRRPTGGRAIFHAHELTYSIVASIDGRSLKEIYRFLNEGLLWGLQLLGIDASLTNENEDFRAIYRDPSSVPCFACSAKNEIQFNGRKLVGSAQRRLGNVVLQHGSFLLGPDHRRIVEFLAHATDSRTIIEENLLNRTTDAETILGRPISFEEAAGRIKKGFEEACDIVFTEDRAPAIQEVLA